MFTYGAADGALTIVGALSITEDAAGSIRPHRLPEHLLPQVPTAFMRLMVDCAAGVRIRFETSATCVRLLIAVHPIDLDDIGADLPASVDLVIDGAVIAEARIESTPARLDLRSDSVTMTPSRVQTVVFDGLRDGTKVVELWLPHNAIVDVFGIETDQPIRAEAPSRRRRWIHHGSSISHCVSVGAPTCTWPAIAARALDLDLLCLGLAGNALLDPFVARAIRDAPADLITLKLGINLVAADLTRARTFAPAVHGFLDTIRDGHPRVPLLVISPISCPPIEARPGPMSIDEMTKKWISDASEPPAPGALTLRELRDELAAVVEQRRRTDEHIGYLDGRELFDDVDAAAGLLPDDLHPDDEGYRRIAERFVGQAPLLTRIGYEA